MFGPWPARRRLVAPPRPDNGVPGAVRSRLHDLFIFAHARTTRLVTIAAIKLLVIEDDPKVVDVVARGLAEEGFAVQTCATGAEGLAGLMEGADACVLDLLLPDIGGLEVLRRARAAGLRTPILVLTACDGLSDRVLGLDSGADDYLVKPFAFAELLARVRALLRRGAPAAPAKVALGDLEIDGAEHRATRAGQTLDLSPAQFALLQFLVRNAGQVVTRGMIMEEVFKYTFDPGTNIVDVHIAHLRRKIDRGGNRSLIQTVRGIGYRFLVDHV